MYFDLSISEKNTQQKDLYFLVLSIQSHIYVTGFRLSGLEVKCPAVAPKVPGSVASGRTHF